MKTEEFIVKLDKKRTAAEIVKAGKYDEVNYLIRNGIQMKKIYLKDNKNETRKIVLLEFDDKVGLEKPVIAARKLKLHQPTYQDAFLFGEQHPEEQTKSTIIFLLESPFLYSGHFFNLILDERKNGRVISLISGLRTGNCRFAFIEK